MSEPIADGKVVRIHYTLKNESGRLLDSSTGAHPLAYLHGAGNIVPGLERALLGRHAGERLDLVVPPEEGYGQRQGPGPQPVPRREFGKSARLEPGMSFRASGTDGEAVVLYVTKVVGSKVWIDRNHPLAGETLHFTVDVVDVRDATDEERTHGHAHAPGHSH